MLDEPTDSACAVAPPTTVAIDPPMLCIACRARSNAPATSPLTCAKYSDATETPRMVSRRRAVAAVYSRAIPNTPAESSLYERDRSVISSLPRMGSGSRSAIVSGACRFPAASSSNADESALKSDAITRPMAWVTALRRLTIERPMKVAKPRPATSAKRANPTVTRARRRCSSSTSVMIEA